MSGTAIQVTSQQTSGQVLFPGVPEADTGTGVGSLEVQGQVVSHSTLHRPRLATPAASAADALITGSTTVPTDSPARSRSS
jgi:hypothetical protein